MSDTEHFSCCWSTSRLPLGLKVVHGFLLLNFLFEMFYAAYQVFVVLAPDGHIGPLGGRAASMSFEAMVTRRLYALEFWVCTTGFSLYLGLTEVLPRLWWRRPASSAQEAAAGDSGQR